MTRRLALPAETDLAALHAAHPAAFPGLLESVASGTPQSRYDILFALPGARLSLAGDQLSGPCAAAAGGQFLDALDRWQAQAVAHAPASPEPSDAPFCGGWMLMLGYELAHQVEPRVPYRQFDPRVPDALAVRCRGAIIRDHSSGQCWLQCEAGVVREELETVQRLIDAFKPLADSSLSGAPSPEQVRVEPAAALEQAIGRIHTYILDGDVFQVNLSRGWEARYAQPPAPAAVYRALSRNNPGPFAGSMQLAGPDAEPSWVISSSPERLLSIRADGANRIVETRPIAGTRRRSADSASDAALRDELLGHPKERAEHVMLIDLERNDLGRVCEPGSVEVDEMMVVESFSHVHHIVSNVRGRLRPDVGPGRAIAAVYPGGTITGCPKVRCMQIIAELESQPRGPYTGAMGYLGLDGQMDLNILIRTLVLAGRSAWVRAGAGIVIDSDPAAEVREMQAKVRGLLPALGIDSEHGL